MRNLLLTLLMVFILSCSGDDETPINPNNKLIIGDEVYSLLSLQIRNENGSFPVEPAADIEFSLTNKTFTEIDSGNDLTDILDVYFDYKELELTEGEYTAIADYRIYVGGSLVSSNYSRGETVIHELEDEMMVQSAVVKISDLSSGTITLEFSFVREDGLEISGYYEGEFREI